GGVALPPPQNPTAPTPRWARPGPAHGGGRSGCPVFCFFWRHPPLSSQRFRKGLADSGYVEGRNGEIDYVTDGQHDRLPIIAAYFARRQVALIVAVSTPPALAAKAATRDIPIVFNIRMIRSSSVSSLPSLVQAVTQPG